MGSSSLLRASFLSRLARDVNCLSDADKHKRRRALDAVARALAALGPSGAGAAARLR